MIWRPKRVPTIYCWNSRCRDQRPKTAQTGKNGEVNVKLRLPHRYCPLARYSADGPGNGLARWRGIRHASSCSSSVDSSSSSYYSSLIILRICIFIRHCIMIQFQFSFSSYMLFVVFCLLVFVFCEYYILPRMIGTIHRTTKGQHH